MSEVNLRRHHVRLSSIFLQIPSTNYSRGEMNHNTIPPIPLIPPLGSLQHNPPSKQLGPRWISAQSLILDILGTPVFGQ